MELEQLYKKRFDILMSIAQDLQRDLEICVEGVSNIDRISSRVKSIERFLKKAEKKENGVLKYNDPINQIQDQIGARITCFYLSDVTSISGKILKYYMPIEQRQLIPESESEFGYVGQHFILHIPTDVIPVEVSDSLIPNFFELQIKTLFQHAWSEASHDLVYKPSRNLTKEQKRKIAFTAAQAWGADMIFDELNQKN